MQPVVEQHGGHSDLALFARILRVARPYWGHIGAIFAVALLATPIALLQPLALKIAVDSALGSEPLPAFLAPLVPAWATASTFRIVALAAVLHVSVVLLIHLQFLAQFLLETYAGERITLRFRSRLLGHAQRLSFAFHDRRGTADSIYRIQYDAPALQHVAIYGVIPFLSAALTLGAMIYVILRIDAQLSLIALAITPLLFFYAYSYKARMRPYYREAKGLESAALEVVQEVLSAFRVVKAFGRERDEEERFNRSSASGMHARIRLAVAESTFGVVVHLTTAVGTAAVLFFGVRNVLSGVLTLGELLIVLSYLGQFFGPLKEISQKVVALQGQLISAQRAFELLDETPEVTERPGARALERAEGRFECRDVSFAYDGSHDTLRNASFSVPPGARVGVVGRTGAGKTTLVSLLPRFYDPRTGAILLDGVDLRDYRLADLRRQFAIVLQDPMLFSTTIRENLAYARPDASFDEIRAAAAAAEADAFIRALPDGYETVVGERGGRLSGGERQRISVARAFLKDAPILILDEPTSSIDVETEASLLETLDRLMQGRTTFMIAHRLGTLRSCDLVLEIDDGRVVLREGARAEAQSAAGDG